MKLKGRLMVAFVTVMTIPILLISVVGLVIIHFQMTSIEQSYQINEQTLQVFSNPIQILNRATRNVYNEIKLCALKTPEKLEDMAFIEDLTEKITDRYSTIVVRKNNDVIYIGNEEFSGKIIGRLPEFGKYSTDVDGGMYLGGDNPLLVKQQDFIYAGGGEGTVFVVTDVSQMVSRMRLSGVQLVVSVICILFLTAALLMYWIYRSILKPLNALRLSTNRMKEGDLNCSITGIFHDEIGEVCDDFEQMRIHMKSLLEDNIQHERESKELISNISHDLKTPLTAIKGYAEGLLDGVADTPQKQDKYLKTIYTKASDMSTLVDELSMYAKIDTNSVPYNFRMLDIDQYFEDSISDIQLDLELHNMELAYFPYIEQDQKVIGDPEQLKRVINNIISNAIKYREPSRKGILCVRTGDDGDYVRVEIEDNGKGIPRTDVANIFDRFYRTDTSRNSSTGGSGLGLAIARKIMEDHGGKIWAESKAGVGTTIFMLLRKAPESIVQAVEQESKTGNEVEKADLYMPHKGEAKTVSHALFGQFHGAARDINDSKSDKRRNGHGQNTNH